MSEQGQIFSRGVHKGCGIISKKAFFSGPTEPASGRVASALCVRSSRISRAFFAFHFLRLVHPDAPLSLHSVRRACCGAHPSSCLPLVFAPLSSHLLASCLLLAVARVRRPSLLPSHLWRPRSVRFHPLPSAAILRRFFLVCTLLPFPQFPYCSHDARRGRHADPLLWLASLPTGEHSFALIIRRTQAAELKPDTFYGNLSLKSPASTWPPIQFNLFKTFP